MDFKPIKDLLDGLEKLITEHGSAAILRERIALVRDKFDIASQENEKLKKENAELVDLNRRLQQELKAKAASDDFVEHRGAHFKRLPSGAYDKVVYYPTCHRSTSSLGKLMPYKCKPCDWSADFNGQELDEVMTGLPR